VLRLSCVHWALRFRSRITPPRSSPQRALGLSHDPSDSLSSSPPPSLPPPFSGSFLPRRFRAPPLITPVRPLASRTLHSIQLRKRTVLCFSASLSSFVVLLLLLAVRSTQPLACVAPKVGPLCEECLFQFSSRNYHPYPPTTVPFAEVNPSCGQATTGRSSVLRSPTSLPSASQHGLNPPRLPRMLRQPHNALSAPSCFVPFCSERVRGIVMVYPSACLT
jgi:hypothetical protein